MIHDHTKNKIIFDSVEEMEEYIIEECPPEQCASYMHCRTMASCRECWQRSGVQIEIKPNIREQIKMADKKEATYADLVYEIIKIECEGMDAIYEDYIVSLVGRCGLGSLKRAGLVEGCGSINCRQLYVLVDKK